MDKYQIINDKGNGIYEVVKETSKIHYYVNENTGTVVAVMRDCRFDAEIAIRRMFPYPIGPIGSRGSLLLKDTYRGKATCLKGDIFDLEKGMIIARRNMLKKYYRAKIKAYRKFYTDMRSFMVSFDSELDAVLDIEYKLTEKID